MNFECNVYKDSNENAGTLRVYGDKTIDLWMVRNRIGCLFSERAPKYKRSLVTYKTHSWNRGEIPSIGYVLPAPIVESIKPILSIP